MSVVGVLKNRHVVIALLVTPVLAVAAWYLVGLWVDGDALQPKAAVEGASYPLIERSGCRYPGGRCVAANGELELEILEVTANHTVTVGSSVALEALWLSVVDITDHGPVSAVSAGDGTRWQAALTDPLSSEKRLRVVVSRGGSHFFTELSLRFLEPAE